MASSYEKVIKKIMDNFSEGLSPLRALVQNQEIIIIQNKKIIDLLDSINANTASSDQNDQSE
jgi:hypothetical protein